MGIDITSGIALGQGIQVSPAFASDPNLSLGTSVAWTSNTIFDTWTSSSSATTDGTPIVNNIWQMFYAHRALRITSGTSGARIGTYQSGSNSWTWALALSGTNNTQSDFGSATNIAAQSASYVSDGTYVTNYSTTINIPRFRYFLIGRIFGPFYFAARNLADNRTATIGGVPYVTVINKLWRGSSTSFSIPSQLGGSATYTEVTGTSQVAGFRFDIP